MIFLSIGAFTQEAEISPWGYGLETSYGVISGGDFFTNYSISFQGIHDFGYGLSVDWIGRYIGRYGRSGLLGSVVLGLPLSRFFIPYVGGGLGIKLGGADIEFAWKADAGVTSWLSNVLYVKAGATYDNIRENFSVSVGVGFKFTKTVTGTYRDYNGTFQRTFTKMLWENSSASNYVYEDNFESSEVVGKYQKNTTSSSYTPAEYEYKRSGGETYKTTLKDRYGNTVGTSTTTTPKKGEFVKTADAKTTTTYYLWNVTVTRNWYIRTYYYKDRAPTTQRFYQDEESGVLANVSSVTE
jgi:hypothetical protein